MDDHDSIEAIEKEGTQIQGTGSTQGETRQLASGSSSQDRHWNRSKKRISSDLEEVSFTASLVRVSPLKVIISPFFFPFFFFFFFSLFFLFFGNLFVFSFQHLFLKFHQENIGNNSPLELEADGTILTKKSDEIVISISK